MREVVHITTREEQDFVCEKLGYGHIDLNWNYITSDSDCFDHVQSILDDGYEIISFNEFKSRYEPQLKICDTFEYNGFVCRVESKVERWIYDKYQEAYYKTKEWDSNHIEITNKEFIKQLEENAR